MTQAFLLGVRWWVGTGKRISGGKNTYLNATLSRSSTEFGAAQDGMWNSLWKHTSSRCWNRDRMERGWIMGLVAVCGMTPHAHLRLQFLIPPAIRASPNAFEWFKWNAVVCYKSFKIHSYKIHGGGKNFVVIMKLLLFVHFLLQLKQENYECWPICSLKYEE